MTLPTASVEDLRTWFNDNADKPRVVALMSPTCGFCLVGHQAIQTYNAWLEGETFVTKRVWIPMMAADSIAHAEEQAASTDDPRITDLYDAEHEVGRAVRDTLQLAAAAWDTYMIFLPGTKWDTEIPKPDHYEYQLWPGYAPDQSRLFTPSSFWWHVVEAVGRSKAEYDAQVAPLAAWLNDDASARVGLEIPAQYVNAGRA